jgi:hypothetical protein
MFWYADRHDLRKGGALSGASPTAMCTPALPPVEASDRFEDLGRN